MSYLFWPQSGRQCQLCRQCLLCRGPTMPFVQTMPIMRLGHCVPKVKLPSCQFPLYAYLALSMAFFGFKICNKIFGLKRRFCLLWYGHPSLSDTVSAINAEFGICLCICLQGRHFGLTSNIGTFLGPKFGTSDFQTPKSVPKRHQLL